jgi:hypothetical protein
VANLRDGSAKKALIRAAALADVAERDGVEGRVK